MAQIIGLKEKQTALADIQNSLKSLKSLNVFISSENDSGEYTISFGSHKAKLKCEDKTKINNLVLAYKATIVKQIRELAEKYQIGLDEEDLEIMR